MARLTFSLFGPPQIALDGRPAAHFAYNKVRALLIYLAVESERPHSREALVGLLWPEQPDAAARTNLRQALANLREVIGDARADPPYLSITRDAIQFNRLSDHALDVRAFDALLDACAAHAHRGLDRCGPCAARLEQALALYGGDFLAQFALADSAPFEEWALLLRERFRQRALDGLVALAAYHERRGDLERAARHARRQLELDPWREEAHRRLMRLLAQSGRRSAALAQYETCRRVLAAELGVEPAAQTVALYRRIRDEREAPSAPAGPPLGLPAAATALVGRETELAHLADLLANPAHRLITIGGPGGIGKTRLAQAVAEREAAVFAHGAAFVPLAALPSAEFLAPAILAALNVPLQSRPEPAQQLLSFLRDKELLLVLDNFEQLLPATELPAEIIRRAPRVTLLVTSRERLALSAEWLVDLAGLPYPDGAPGAETGDYAALRLFLERAQQVQPSFSLEAGEADSAARICRLVEGMPLALELAAALVRQRSCALIAAELESGLQALVTSLRDVPERHRRMVAAFEQSWRLLSPAERDAFNRLSVFRGGFRAEAARSVGGGSDALLAALVEKSLVRRSAGGRYELHELLRQYGADKLCEAGGRGPARERHLDFCLALAEEAEQFVYGAEQARWLGRLAEEHDNLRAALSWAIEQRAAEPALRLAVALYYFWYVRGFLLEGYRWLEQALGLPVTEPSALRARALNSAGFMAYRLGFYDRARSLYDEALASGRELGNEHSIASSLSNLGTLARVRGDLASATALLAESLALRQKLGDLRDTATALNNLAIALREAGDYPRAQALLEENLSARRELGDSWGIAAGLKNLGDVAMDRGDGERAVGLYEEGLAAFRALDDRRSAAITLKSLGEAARRRDRHAHARAHYAEALALLKESGDQPEIEATLRGLAAVDMAEHRPERAVRLLGAADALRDALGAPLPPAERADYEGDLAAARAALGETAFAAAWSEGRALATDDAIAFALAGA